MTTIVHPDLQEERSRATFDPLQLTYVLDGGKARTQRRRYIESLAVKDPEITGRTNRHFMSQNELYEDGIKANIYEIQRIKELGLTDPQDIEYYHRMCFPCEPNPLALQTSMFIPTLLQQATEEQQKEWLPLARSYHMIGTYAQTEMGHGTFLRGLETTATFDKETDEFILHSPTLSSIKWWPGGLGKSCNHAMVMAILYIKGISYGMNAFLVPLRSIDTHQPLPGITVGDIGPKLGYNRVDNGFLKLDQVRIPRKNMFMKNAEVQRDGTYIKKGKHSKLAYGVMVLTRTYISHDAAMALAAACTIAIRYSAVRRQSELQPGGREPQILDYQTQQHKLLPNLAASYAYLFASNRLINIYNQMTSRVQQGDVDLIPEAHCLSAGLKAFNSYRSSIGIEVCRMACGGHGFSQSSGLPKLYVNTTQMCTYEGENTVLLLQTARYLIKCYREVETGGQLANSVAYLLQQRSTRCHFSADFSPQNLVTIFQHAASSLIDRAGRHLQDLQAKGRPYYEAWNMSAVYLVQAAEAHIQFFIIRTFADWLANSDVDRAVGKVMTQLFQLHATHSIVENSGHFIQDGFMTQDQLDQVHDKELELLSALRPNAVALVDAFDMSDHLLGSVLGRYDGNVYENLYKWAQQSPLNQSEVHEAFHKYVKPFRAAAKL